jgi:hypothetical protein
MLVSTFELLVKPISPAGPTALARTVVQGYFLTIANTNDTPVRLRLTFRATSPNIDLAKTVTIQDVVGNNVFGDLTQVTPTQFTYDIALPANDTALVTFLPDVTLPSVLADKNLEIRGYVDIQLLRSSNQIFATAELLLTPEHRGTFFAGGAEAPGADIDQLAYALPTAIGRAQYTLLSSPLPKPLVKDVADIPSIPKTNLPEGSVAKPILEVPTPKNIVENPAIPGSIQEVLVEMAQRVDQLTTVAEGQAFIQPAERPAVGNQILNAVGNGN